MSEERKGGGGSKKGRRLAPQFLRDMRWVWENELPAGQQDETVGRRRFREMLTQDPAKYAAALRAAEAEHAKAKTGAAGKAAAKTAVADLKAEVERLAAENAELRERLAGEAAAGPDAGSARALAQIEKLLKGEGS